jgi:hypothetical protein
MSTLLDDAIQVLRAMPENLQDAAAHAILDYAWNEDQRASA